jgi:oligopeptide/dipeptide ABC transporter ATP-binding protein
VLLELQGLSVSFRTSRGQVEVVSGLSFGIPRGSFFGLAGESGCGKSLTALAIMGLLPEGARASGRVLFEGTDLLSLPPAEMRCLRGKELAMVFQEPMTSLNPVLRVGYQVMEALLAHRPLSKAEAQQRAVELLRAVRLPSPELRLREYPHQLSGGMRQRVMLAMAIACGPKLLLADEPTTALDVTIEAQILELIDSLRRQRQMAVLLISHDLATLAEWADTIGVMYAGRLMELGPAGELFSRPLHPYTRGLLESLPRAGQPLRPIPGMVPPPWRLPEGCKFSDRCPFAQQACRRQEPELQALRPAHAARCIRAEELFL